MKRAKAATAIATAAIISIGAAFSWSQPVHAKMRRSVAASPAVQQTSGTNHVAKDKQDSGELVAMLPSGRALGSCPLKHTQVKADVSGYIARVSVTQVFQNTFNDKIEAVYTFPLSDTAAVDEMIMKVGNRTIHGAIKKREEARQIYDVARNAGQVASLLDQERTNIFTQSVANIKPGETIEVTLNYVDVLPYVDGDFSFTFPTVVGPRFMPGNATGKQGTGRSFDTDQVADASRISPPIATERAGHDISIDVHIDAGVPIGQTQSKLHPINIKHLNGNEEVVSLENRATIPNKDFVLKWSVASDKLSSGYLATKKGKDGYFTMMLLPPKRVAPHEVSPKEMVFLIDCSGSQSGAPLNKAKETMLYILDHMNANDTFQVIAFSDHLNMLSQHPIKVTRETIGRAKEFVNSLQANGGTWMAPAVEKVCSQPEDEHRLRIVSFMTDGYVGNDQEIIGMVKKLRGKSRWFPFGTGNSVNRMLIDEIAKEGGGEPEYVLLNEAGNVVGHKFYERIASPVLTDVGIDFHGLPVKEVFPHAISDVWAQRPLYITGRYTAGCAGTVTLTGFAGGKPYKQDLKVNFPESDNKNSVISSIWARKKVDRLMSEDWIGVQNGSFSKELREEVTKVALEHHIMTEFTSFVAVEDKPAGKHGAPRTVPVEVEQADGVSREMTSAPAGMQLTKPSVANALGKRAKGINQPSYNGPQRMQIACSGGGFGGYAKMSPSPASPSMPSPPLPSGSIAPAQVKAALKKQPSSNVVMDRLEDQSKDKEEVRDEKSSASEPQVSGNLNKLDRTLTNMIKTALHKQGGLEACSSKVTVRITLSKQDSKVLAHLKALGAEIVMTETSNVVARVELKRILQLTNIAEVITIQMSQAKPAAMPAKPPIMPIPLHFVGMTPKEKKGS